MFRPSSLKKYNFFFQIRVVFSAWCDKMILVKNESLGLFDSLSKISILEKVFVEK